MGRGVGGVIWDFGISARIALVWSCRTDSVGPTISVGSCMICARANDGFCKTPCLPTRPVVLAVITAVSQGDRDRVSSQNFAHPFRRIPVMTDFRGTPIRTGPVGIERQFLPVYPDRDRFEVKVARPRGVCQRGSYGFRYESCTTSFRIRIPRGYFGVGHPGGVSWVGVIPRLRIHGNIPHERGFGIPSPEPTWGRLSEYYYFDDAAGRGTDSQTPIGSYQTLAVGSLLPFGKKDMAVRTRESTLGSVEREASSGWG